MDITRYISGWKFWTRIISVFVAPSVLMLGFIVGLILLNVLAREGRQQRVREEQQQARVETARQAEATARQEAFLAKIRTVEGIQAVSSNGATIWVNVSLGAFGYNPELKAQDMADMIATQYKRELGSGICVRVTYGAERQLARSCVS